MACYHSRKVRVVGLLVLIGVALLAVVAVVMAKPKSGALTIDEVTRPGLPSLVCRSDYCWIPGFPR